MLPVFVSDPCAMLLLLVLFLAVMTDVTQHRIPNLLTFGAAGCGLVLQAWQQGWGGFSAGLAGMLTGFLLLLPFYLAKGMRAGDIKLMAAVGVFLGFQTAWAVGFSLIVGLFLGVAVLLWNGGGKDWFRRYLVMFMLAASTGKWSYQPPVAGEAASISFPYATAIASGSLVAMLMAHAG